jgi:hypothetical protein
VRLIMALALGAVALIAFVSWNAERRIDDLAKDVERNVRQLEGPGAARRVEADVRVVLSGCKRGNSLRNEARLERQRTNDLALDLLGERPREPGPGVAFISDCVAVTLAAVPDADRATVERIAGPNPNLSTER